MNKFFLLLIALLSNGLLVAQLSQGPLTTNTASNNVRTGAAASWFNLSNVGASDNLYAEIPANSLSSNGAYTDNFWAQDFGFTIPGATNINGIEFRVERADVNNAKDDYIGVIKNGVVGSTNKSKNPAWSSEAVIVYGGPTDLWGTTWTPGDINSTDFGISISIRKQGGGANPQPVIDHITATVYYSNWALPIELLSFKAERENGIVALSWITSSEINNEKFLVERSEDGENWDIIHEVRGAGNSNSIRSYEVFDPNPTTQISYYRLTQIDYDGMSTQYDVVEIKGMNFIKDELSIFTNPVADHLILTSTKAVNSNELVVIDQKGSLISLVNRFNSISENEIVLDVSNLKSGIYFISHQEKVLKFIKL